MSVQLEALADEVFDAAAAQARIGSQSRRLPFGEAIWNPIYPDLFFLNGIGGLTAPDWSVEDLERAVGEIMPNVRQVRAYSRDPRTVATLGVALIKAGYHHEIRVGMIQTHSEPSPFGGGQGGGFAILPISDVASWSDFENSIRSDGMEHGWSPAMIDQITELYRWRAASTPHRYFLAYLGDQPVAHVGLFQHGATAYLHGLYTRPEARRRGAGRSLTIAMSVEARDMGCDRLALQCTDDGHLPAYYSRLGYRAVGEQHIWTKPL